MSFWTRFFGKKKSDVENDTTVNAAETKKGGSASIWKESDDDSRDCIYKYSFVNEDGIYIERTFDLNQIVSASGGNPTSHLPYLYGFTFATMENPTVKKLAEKYEVSRTSASNRLHALETREPDMWKYIIQPILDKNRKDSIKKAADARKKKDGPK